jgi:hypothetical protein
MTSRSRERLAKLKAAWFERGADALSRTVPGLPERMYGCPLCLRAAASPNAFTFEHVPPESVGGRRLCLTCADCNSAAGARLDHHVKTASELREIAAGEREMPVQVTLQEHGHRISARMRKTDSGFELAGVPERSDKRAHKAFFDTLNDIAATGRMDWGFRLQWKVKYRAEAERISWLRTAFLVAFSMLGYRYAYLNTLGPVRRQVREPEKSLLPSFLLRAEGAAPEARVIAFVREPESLRGCIMVQRGPMLTILPGLTDDEGEYTRVLAGLTPDTVRGRVDGLSADWPREPQYRLDFEPKLAAMMRREQMAP